MRSIFVSFLLYGLRKDPLKERVTWTEHKLVWMNKGILKNAEIQRNLILKKIIARLTKSQDIQTTLKA